MSRRTPRSSRRETSLKRRSGFRSPTRKVLIVYEGETEHRYFSGLRDSTRHTIQPVKPEKSRYPQKERVIAHARTALRKAAYSKVWAVFDADGVDIKVMCQEAQEEGVMTAASNPAFETWLVLHLRDRVKARTAKGLEKELQEAEPRWRKGEGTRFEYFADGLELACERARKLPEHGNPSTGVWRLIESIQG